MRTQDIIRQEMNSQGMGNVAEKFLQGVALGLQNKSLGIMRESNTVILFKAIDAKSLEVHIYTTDSPIALGRALKKFYETFKEAGIEFLESKTDNPSIIKLIESVGIPIKAYKVGPSYKIEIEVQ